MLVVGDNAPAEDGVVSGAVNPAGLKGCLLVAASSLEPFDLCKAQRGREPFLSRSHQKGNW